MRKLIVTEFMTLDGSIGAPMWSFPYWGDDIAAFKGEETQSTESDTLLLGRVTYQGFAQAWPGRSPEEGGAYFNGVEKAVVTSTLESFDWENSHKLEGGLVEGVKALKERDGGNVVVHGSGTLARALINEGLVDEIRLLIYPLTVGEGPRLFEDGMANKFTLVKSQAMASGVVGLVYAPAAE
jgi:dihydrofolate reductase